MNNGFNLKNFIEYRKKSHLSISAFSRLSGIHRNTISRWEKGEAVPSEAMIKKLTSILSANLPKISSQEIEKAISDKNIPSLFQCWKSIKTIKPQSIDKVTDILSGVMEKIGVELKTQNLINKAIFKNTENIKYIKGLNLKYLYVNEAFLKYFAPTIDFDYISKTDHIFFSRQEAVENEKEDSQILLTGASVQREGYIPGTRRKKFGFIFKSLLKDENGNVLGLFCEMFDITYFNKIEELRVLLQKCIDKTDMFIWMGQGLKYDEKGYPHAAKVIFIFGSNALTSFYGDFVKLNDQILSIQDSEKIAQIRKLVPEDQKRIFTEGIKNGTCPIIRQYFMKSPYTQKEINVLEFIYYDSKTELMIGIMFSLAPDFQLSVGNWKMSGNDLIKEHSSEIAKRLRNFGVSEDIIKQSVF